MKVNDIKECGLRINSILKLSGEVIGVRLLSDGTQPLPNTEWLKQHRYCQALMKARHGQSVLLDSAGISCPAAAAAFGFRPLPEGLRNGSGLVGFGIVADAKIGQQMFEHMPKFSSGQIKGLHLFPLAKAEVIPDIAVIEDEIEKLMWINLAYLNATGGKRINSSTAILQATCVDSTIIPFLEQRLNFSYGCYGCREATDIKENESVLGFPTNFLLDIVENLEYLNEKAIPNSRSKRALTALQRLDADNKKRTPRNII
ncbi:MAG: hypothetical protein GYA34_06870 [Chloroflexi bacterium]|nr:hypothetical protein [Chloroflexota bacterium]